jgi:SAM-dependent methyltransferase
MAVSDRVLFNPTVWRFASKYWYPLLTRWLGNDQMLFLNNGYEESPPMGLELSEADEPNRAPIQLYYRTATQADIAGKKVLEVSSGHGGGASFLTRTLKPASYTGLDLNAAGVAFCRRRHDVPGLEFVEGNAENLPFADSSFDAVINVEASHCYPSLPKFLSEVARVLNTGGHFLYADVRRKDRIPDWDADLAAAPLRMVSCKDINEQVLLGLEQTGKYGAELVNRNVPGLISRLTRNIGALDHSDFYRSLKAGEFTWRMYDFVKE